MEHPSHEHPLILNEKYIARKGDVCRGCGEQIMSCKSFVYSCSSITGTDISVHDRSCAAFLLHKSCAELPLRFQNPNKPKKLFLLSFDFASRFVLVTWRSVGDIIKCDICALQIPWFSEQFFYYSEDAFSCLCVGCVVFQTQTPLEDPKSLHPSHNQHLLSLIQNPSSFKCYACNVDDNIRDMSYKCTRCRFWIHKSCADAPMSFHFQFHDKHPLILSFSLPPVYHKFEQFCGVCSKRLSRSVWIYYCSNCRFFAHFQCARSSHLVSPCEIINDDTAVQLPVADELSANLIWQQFVKAMIIDSSNVNNNIISESVINHWTHEEHHLQLINSTGELKIQQDDDEKLLLCDGCVQPIGNDQFYGCVSCNYFLHKSCAELPKKMIKHPLLGFNIIAHKRREPYKLFRCIVCKNMCNGIFCHYDDFYFHIGCLTLPKMIKHEAHRHILEHTLFDFRQSGICKACRRPIQHRAEIGFAHRCKECEYSICGSCIMKPRVAKHPWDIHPLRLIYEPGMVDDHEHDFNCEFCSQDIDTNGWFYHCSDCDLSFHLHECFQRSSYQLYSRVKFGATNIIIDQLHPHSLTFVLNKKFRKCEKCHRNQLGEPVLECASPCKSIFCTSCIEVITKKQDVQDDPLI